MSNGIGSNAASARWRRPWRCARSSGSTVAAGAALSSAMVMDEIAPLFGNCEGFTFSISMITDVSRRPTGILSATEINILVRECFEIVEELLAIDRWSPAEGFEDCLNRYHPPTTHRPKLAHRLRVPRHHVRLALIQPTKDLCTVVSQLSLTDDLGHSPSVASSATAHEGGPHAASTVAGSASLVPPTFTSCSAAQSHARPRIAPAMRDRPSNCQSASIANVE